jgi:hypothetical protein
MFDARLKAGTPRVNNALAFEGCHDDWGNIVKPGADPLTKGQENPKIVVFKYGRFFHLCFENEWYSDVITFPSNSPFTQEHHGFDSANDEFVLREKSVCWQGPVFKPSSRRYSISA